MAFHPEPDTWLFGSVFRVTDRSKKKKYSVELTELGRRFDGRLKIHFPHKNRATRTNMENSYEQFEVKEILPKRYSGLHFPGSDNINASFMDLESLISEGKPDWKSVLENSKGVYMLTDSKSGKQYIGAAYGKHGIWSRWQNYIKTGHGGNAGIKEFLKKGKKDREYCRQHFRFALLEQRSSTTSDTTIQQREAYWKQIIETRGKKGLNRN